MACLSPSPLAAFFFFLPFSPHTSPVAQSSLADMAAHMNYGNVNTAWLPCTLSAGALLGSIFTAKYLCEKLEDRKMFVFLGTTPGAAHA